MLRQRKKCESKTSREIGEQVLAVDPIVLADLKVNYLEIHFQICR